MRRVKVWKTTEDEKPEPREGWFHEWGTDYEEFESGPGPYSVAIVEFDDGSVGLVYPMQMRFLEPPPDA